MTHLKFLKCFCFLILFIFASSQNLLSEILQYENLMIEKVEVVNQGPSENFDEGVVLSRIKTRKGEMFSQSDFDSDLKALAQDYDRIEPIFNVVDSKMHIVLKIWPKPTIRSINWSGNERIKTKRLQEELKIPCFSVFDRRAFNQAFHKLKAYYVKKGFFEAELNYNVQLDPATNEIDIEICIVEGRAGLIKDIIFVNFTSCEEEDLCDLLVTKKYNIFLSWLNNEGTYNEDMVQHDQMNILNYLHNKGYADATIDIKVNEAEQDNRIIIVITACKGPIYRVGNISIEGYCLYTEEDIRNQFTFREGGIYSPEKIRDTVDNITNLYGRRGYIDATVDHEPTLSDCEDCVYNLKFTIEEGEQFRVGLIKVFGNCQTQTRVILHETLIIPGEVFNVEKLKKTEERLSNVGYFSHVNVYAVKSDGPCGLGDNYRDVHIEVEETSTGNFGAFFGFSTNESLFGGFNITEKNFNYRGLGRFWRDGYKALRGGGEYVNATATIGSRSRSYVLSWTKPFFNDTKWTVGFDLENSSNRYISKDYNIKTYGGTANAVYQVNQFVRVGWHYRLKHSDVGVRGCFKRDRAKVYDLIDNHPDLEDHVRDPLKEAFDAQNKISQQRESELSGMVSASGVTFTYDSTDHPSKPTCGFKSRLEFEVAGLGGNFRFFGTAYTNSYYYPVDKKTVLKFRADFRFIYPFAGTKPRKMPLDERLFLGGDNLIRGYRPYRLGPHFCSKDDPRGGMSMQIYSVELSRLFMKNLECFAFFDAGHLSFAKFDFGLADSRIYSSIGVGARVKILESMPPLTLGYGVPLNPKNRGEVKNFFISVGGRF